MRLYLILTTLFWVWTPLTVAANQVEIVSRQSNPVQVKGQVESPFASLRSQLHQDPSNVLLGNTLRAWCRQNRAVSECSELFEALLNKFPQHKAIHYNAALSYIDDLAGHSLLSQARLSLRSIAHANHVLAADPTDWLALYIRGLNNLYWPRWLSKTRSAIQDFQQCLEISNNLPHESIKSYHVLAFVALGDALVKSGDISRARAVWRDGLTRFTSSEIPLRLEASPESLPSYIETTYDLSNPPNTDLSFLFTP